MFFDHGPRLGFAARVLRLDLHSQQILLSSRARGLHRLQAASQASSVDAPRGKAWRKKSAMAWLSFDSRGCRLRGSVSCCQAMEI